MEFVAISANSRSALVDVRLEQLLVGDPHGAAHTRASSLKLEPFCRDGFGSRSSGPSQCVAVLRTRRDAQRSGQIRPARRVCKRRPPSSSKRLPVAPATGCTLLLLARLAVCKQNCFQLKARRSNAHRLSFSKSLTEPGPSFDSRLEIGLPASTKQTWRFGAPIVTQ